MILKELYLYPDLAKYPKDLTNCMRDKTRCLCNYLERNVLKRLRFKTENFKRICVIGSQEPNEKVIVNTSNVACVEVRFDENEYLSMSGVQLEEYFISLLLEGLANLDKNHPIPIAELSKGVESFRNDGYKNQWVHKSKAIKGTGLKANLNCVLTTEKFILTLSICKDNNVVYENEVLNTPPDEIVFVPMFKDLVINESELQITDKFGGIVYELSISEVA